MKILPCRRPSRSSLRHRLPACESGNALIELAFSLPLFLILILGTAEIANLAWASVQVNNAARAAVAYASASRANAASLNILSVAQAEAPSLSITSPSGPIPQVCYCVTDGTSGPPASGCTNATLTSCAPPSVIAVQVNLQAVVTPFIHYPGLPATYTVNAQATMGVAQ